METKRYLGDGVYADLENGMLKLTVEDGEEVQHVIYLEPGTLSSLQDYIEDFADDL